jgi:hypothetical protein
LKKELIAIAASIPSTLGGGTGVIMEPAKYLLMTGGTAFVNLANPGVYQDYKQMQRQELKPGNKQSTKNSLPNMKSSKESNRDSRTSFRKQLKRTNYWKSKTKHLDFQIKHPDK